MLTVTTLTTDTDNMKLSECVKPKPNIMINNLHLTDTARQAKRNQGTFPGSPKYNINKRLRNKLSSFLLDYAAT